MIVAEIKPIEEIKKMVKGKNGILLLGCNTCTAVCFASGKRELELLQTQLPLSIGKSSLTLWQAVVRRVCEPEMVKEVADYVKEVEAILCLSCGIGVQTVSDVFPKKEVFPALNTSFLGRPEKLGLWWEVCVACGDCILHLTGGICPLARCAKGLLNGPCGGSHEGKCEVSPEVPCAWEMISARLRERNKLHELEKIRQAGLVLRKPRQLLRRDIFEDEE